MKNEPMADVTHTDKTILTVTSAYYAVSHGVGGANDGILVWEAGRNEWVGYIVGKRSLQYNQEVWHGQDAQLIEGINAVISANRTRLEESAGHALNWESEEA